MSNLVKHAEIELELLLRDGEEDSLIAPYKDQILAIVEQFSKEGHSGGSAPYGAAAITSCLKNLLSYKPLAPVTGEEWEWVEVGPKVRQNRRCSALFKEDEDKRAYYLDAITWKTQTGSTWSGRAEELLSRQYVRFPFTPKTFVIDVIETEIAPDNWEFAIKDRNQLKEVFEYYDQYTERPKAD